MKKLIPVLTGAIMLLSLAACGSRTAAPEATTAPAAAGGKTLVVYFSATSSTKTAAIGIGHTAHRAGHCRVKAGPAAAGLELVVRMVERHAALAADIGARLMIVDIFARIGRLCGLAQQHIRLQA